MFLIRSLIICALSFGLSAAARSAPRTILDCNHIAAEKKSRICHAEVRGLPKHSTWDEISLHDGETILQEIAIDLKLPADSTWETILELLAQAEEDVENALKQRAHDEEMKAWSERFREQRSTELGIPIDSSWEQINTRASDLSRQEYARENGLPTNATWDEIQKVDVRKTAAHFKSLGIDIYAQAPQRKKTVK